MVEPDPADNLYLAVFEVRTASYNSYGGWTSYRETQTRLVYAKSREEAIAKINNKFNSCVPYSEEITVTSIEMHEPII